MNNPIQAVFDKNSIAPNVSRGLIAGVLGGLAGTLVKSTIEKFLPVRKTDTKSAQVKLVDDLSIKVTGSKISEDNHEIAEQLVNIPFGASLGATYGYAKRDKLGANIIEGAVFGASTWIGTHETSLPILGLEEEPKDIPTKLQANELLAHVAFGITTELVRSFVVRRLNR